MDALAALSVALPLLVAAALVGLAPLCSRRAADAAAVGTAAGVTGESLVGMARSQEGPVGLWLGGG